MILRSEMSVSAAEFVRMLGHFARRAGLSLEEAGPGRWRLGAALVSMEPLDELRLGALRLERQRLELDLSALEEDEARRFHRAFVLSFHRGGG